MVGIMETAVCIDAYLSCDRRNGVPQGYKGCLFHRFVEKERENVHAFHRDIFTRIITFQSNQGFHGSGRRLFKG